MYLEFEIKKQTQKYILTIVMHIYYWKLLPKRSIFSTFAWSRPKALLKLNSCKSIFQIYYPHIRNNYFKEQFSFKRLFLGTTSSRWIKNTNHFNKIQKNNSLLFQEVAREPNKFRKTNGSSTSSKPSALHCEIFEKSLQIASV